MIEWEFALYLDGIYISTTSTKAINPKTGKRYQLLKIRIAITGDVLSPGQAKYLEPEEIIGNRQDVEECDIKEQKSSQKS